MPPLFATLERSSWTRDLPRQRVLGCFPFRMKLLYCCSLHCSGASASVMCSGPAWSRWMRGLQASLCHLAAAHTLPYVIPTYGWVVSAFFVFFSTAGRRPHKGGHGGGGSIPMRHPANGGALKKEEEEQPVHSRTEQPCAK